MRARRNALISVQAAPSISGQDYLGSDKKAGGSSEWVLPGLISSLHHVVKDLELHHNERAEEPEWFRLSPRTHR